MTAVASPTSGSDRFELRGQLGSGGAGVVHRVLDRVRGRELAMKTLKSHGARELYRFKREFRAFADLAHPNLVALHELYTVGDEWMFTMELVDGVPFLRWVRPPAAGVPPPTLEDETQTSPTRVGVAPPIPPSALDEARLRAALDQLCDGVAALHAAGKLHRDLKPSNVLVDATGRVVILDFGLVADADADSLRADHTHERAAVGTPIYMSPEQAADQPLTEASDWYAVGVMLYEALTGRRPFEGGAQQILLRKQREDPPPPHAVASGVPADLDRLCVALLARDPQARPDARAVLAALGREPSVATRRIAQLAARAPFIGRADELAALRKAFVDSRQRCVASLVLGPSGLGKTALVRAFLDEVSVDGEAVILEGRCYEREKVPYKALDQVIDGLTTHLLGMPAAELAKLIPHDVGALVRQFPVIRRVPALHVPALPGATSADPLDLRRRAFEALREILGELAESHAVVIAIDDLQWGDIDGAWALAELVRQPGAPRIHVVVSHRTEDVDGSAPLETLRRWNQGELREVSVGALPDGDARALWSALGGDTGDADAVRDAGGNPLLLGEIARARAAGDARVTSVDDAVRARVARLDPDARALLETIALAARPLDPDRIAAAAGVADPAAALASLRMELLARVRGGDRLVVEPFHDRIREAVADGLTPEQRHAVHAGLARVIGSDDAVDRELLIEHLLGAGEGARASHQAERAAHEAEERFAFHQASALYGLALLHGELDDAHRCDVTARRAQTLAQAGRLVEAAVEFRVAASLTRGRAKFALQRHSVENLLRAGRLDRGLAAAESLLAEVGVQMPATWRRTLLALAVERARIRLRGLGFTERPAAEVDPDLLERLDVLWSVSSGFSFVNPVLGRVLQARFLRESLGAGDLRRAVQALALELGFVSMAGGKAHDRSEDILARARALAARLDQPDATGMVEAAAGLASFLTGRFREAYDRLRAGELAIRRQPTEMRWQLDLCEVFGTAALWCLGDLRELLRLHPEYLRSAEERGNVYAQQGLRGWRSNVVWLVRGEPEEARAQARRAFAGRGPDEPFHLHHYYDVLAQGLIDLYERKGGDAYSRVEAVHEDMKRSHLFRVQNVDIEYHWLRGAAAVATAKRDKGRLAIADECVRHLESMGSPYARVLAAQLLAAAAARRGATARAIEALRAAIASAEVAEMAVHHAVARMRLGRILGGPEGRALVEAGEAWLREQGVGDPVALAGMLSPGYK